MAKKRKKTKATLAQRLWGPVKQGRVDVLAELQTAQGQRDDALKHLNDRANLEIYAERASKLLTAISAELEDVLYRIVRNERPRKRPRKRR